MKRELFLVAVLCIVLCVGVFAGGTLKISGSQTITIAVADSTVWDTVWLYSQMDLDGIIGLVWLDSCITCTTGWGVKDTAIVMVKSEMDGLVYLLDSVKCTSVPCTLEVNALEDSLFLENVFTEVYWADTVKVPFDTVCNGSINWVLKILRRTQ